MDTDGLSLPTYKGIILESETFNHDLTLQFGVLAFELNPDAYWIGNLKAKIQLEMKDYKNAMATAEIAKKLAATDGDTAYVKMADEIIATAKKGGK